jgi:hypothetical protein
MMIEGIPSLGVEAACSVQNTSFVWCAQTATDKHIQTLTKSSGLCGLSPKDGRSAFNVNDEIIQLEYKLFCGNYFSHSSPPIPTELAYIRRLRLSGTSTAKSCSLLMTCPDCPRIFSLSTYHTISLNVANCPLVFTRVCRLWRVVAHSTPEVWSRIQVAPPGNVKRLSTS